MNQPMNAMGQNSAQPGLELRIEPQRPTEAVHWLSSHLSAAAKSCHVVVVDVIITVMFGSFW